MSVTPPQGDQQTPPQSSDSDDDRPGRRRRAVDLDPETLRRHARFTGWLILALIVSYLGLQLPLPYRLLAVVAGMAGAVGAVILLIRCIRHRLPAMITVSATAALVCCGIFGVTASAQALFWGATVEFDQCRDQALTERSLAQCYVEYEESMLTTIPGLP